MSVTVKAAGMSVRDEGQMKDIDLIVGHTPPTESEINSAVGINVKEQINKKVGYSEVVNGQLLMYSDDTKETLLATLDLPKGTVTDVQVNGTTVTTDGVANIPAASTSKLGVVGIDEYNGIRMDSSNRIKINEANKGLINNRTTVLPIVPLNLDYAVKAALCDGKGDAYSDTEKANACVRIGTSLITKLTQEEYDLIEAPDEDTIYLVQDEDSVSDIYLGNKRYSENEKPYELLLDWTLEEAQAIDIKNLSASEMYFEMKIPHTITWSGADVAFYSNRTGVVTFGYGWVNANSTVDSYYTMFGMGCKKNHGWWESEYHCSNSGVTGTAQVNKTLVISGYNKQVLSTDKIAGFFVNKTLPAGTQIKVYGFKA